MPSLPDRPGTNEYVDVPVEVALEHLIGDLEPGTLRAEDVRSAGRIGSRYAVWCRDGRRFVQAERGVALFRHRRWDGGEEVLTYRLGALVRHTITPPRPTRIGEN